MKGALWWEPAGRISRWKSARCALPPHLNPLPRRGGEEDRVAMSFVRGGRPERATFSLLDRDNSNQTGILISWVETRWRRRPAMGQERGRFSLLSLSKRERIKVRDFPRLAPQWHTKWPEARHRDSLALHRSKTAASEFQLAPGTGRALHPVAAAFRRRARSHPARRRGGPRDSKNPGCIFPLDADAGICGRRASDCAGVATECARLAWRSCAGAGRDSLAKGIAKLGAFDEARFLPSDLNSLSRNGAEEDRVETRGLNPRPINSAESNARACRISEGSAGRYVDWWNFATASQRKG